MRSDSSSSQQQILDVASQHNHFQYPSDDPGDATTPWINQLKGIWALWKKSEGVTKMLQEYFASVPNPYEATLQMMMSCGDIHQSKQNSLSFTVMEEFSSWTANKEADLKRFLTPHIKFEAFTLGTQQRSMLLTRMMFSTYHLIDDKELFVEPIRNLVFRKQYKEACQSAVLLQLHEHFTVEDFIIPLVFQDKVLVAEEFLSGSPNHQQILVSFLDELLGKRNSFGEAESVIERLNIPDVKTAKLHYKPLGKLIARLTKQYNLPPESCPNLNRKRSAGALQFLIHKRYIENGLGHESWREMVREAVGDNEDLHLELVQSVNNSGDPQEALYWANAYGIPKHKQPYNVQPLQEKASCSQQQGAEALICNVNQEEETWDDDLTKVHYYELRLPQDDIYVVDTGEKFKMFLDYIKLRNVSMVGIDSEWKPFFGTKKNELALIQIASKERVYILDVCSLGLKYPERWNELEHTLFTNENIIKLGFSLIADMRMMKSSLPHLGEITFRGPGYIDLAVLWRKLVQKHQFMFPYEDKDGLSGESLTCLVHLCLGQHLDKSDQFSNWERRPLRVSQKLYAALDAYCLLEVYEVLSQCADKQNIPFKDICSEIMTNVKYSRKTTKHSKKQLKRENPTIVVAPSPHTKPTPASQFRVVCDNMVCGLGKMLRKCGVDTVILGNDNHDVCVRIANQQNRMIITRGHVYNLLYQHVPPGHCYPLVSDVLEDQLEEVLRYFNIVVTRQDVFSRCQMCNGGDFVVVTRDVMHQLADASQRIAQVHTKSEEFGWEEAEGFSSESDGYSEEGTAPPCTVQYQNVESGVIVELCQTRKGVRVNVDTVPKGVLNKEQKFYICEDCGKCYWDGSHFERLVGGRLQKIVMS